MKYEPLDIIQLIIESEPQVTNLIGSTEGYPNVAQELAPDEMRRPYIVLRIESDPIESNDLLGRALISVDIYTEGDRPLARQIGNAIEKLVHNKGYDSETEGIGAGAVSTFRKFRHEPPQPDPSIKCVQVKVVLRYYRDDLYE
ncbi:hypothetical protein [Bacillus sp. Hm123]|uniref:hypothetical protein n=1 Tax=Bacillus sp. Hm123 TaxID=3450745 RepID=UPI003F4370B0